MEQYILQQAAMQADDKQQQNVIDLHSVEVTEGGEVSGFSQKTLYFHNLFHLNPSMQSLRKQLMI